MKQLFKELVQLIDRVTFSLSGQTPEQRKAIAELSAYSDRELADLGIARSTIVDAVMHGHPTRQSASKHGADAVLKA